MIFFKEILKNKGRILEEIITFLFEDFYFYLMLISYLKYMKYEILKKKKEKKCFTPIERPSHVGWNESVIYKFSFQGGRSDSIR